MCGILGYSGSRQASPVLLDGLAKLEYRGYDSAGLAVRDGTDVKAVKAKGRLKALAERINSGKALSGTCGIGHTRWATHGVPSEENAHPHWSDDMTVVAVHNGIVENYQELKEELLRNGYTFYSQTDTEVAVKLIDLYYKKSGNNPVAALTKAMKRIRGSYCFVLMFREFPDAVWGVRKDNPLIVGKGDGESFLASDVSAILQYTRTVYYIGNMEIVEICKGDIRFYDKDGRPLDKASTEIKWDAQAAEKGGFEHFMMKEIHEQGRAVRDTLRSVLKEGSVLDMSATGLTNDEIRNFSQIYILACGSAYHAGVAAQYVLEDLVNIPVRVELASEFRYRKIPLDPSALAIVISQSGETADTLAAMRLAQENGIRTLAIVNLSLIHISEPTRP